MDGVERRRLVQAGIAVVGGVLLGGCSDRPPAEDNSVGGTRGGSHVNERGLVMPDEAQAHKRTWMAFGASEAIWGATLLAEVRRNLVRIAQTIARFEPVSMLVRPDEMELARGLVGLSVELIAAPIDDIWIRDTGPVFVKGENGTAGVEFNFNGWGGKQEHDHDARVASFVTSRAGVSTVHTDLVLEGGGIDVDGQGTAIVTASCVLNTNRNPGCTKAGVEKELNRLLGVEKVIWLPGIAGKDVTDGHIDFYARFARPGLVVAALDRDPESFDHEVTQRHLEILKIATDAHGRPLQVEVLEAPSQLRSAFQTRDFAVGYINFYVCNCAVIAAEFGDPDTDLAAKETLEKLFPGRQVIQINIDAVAAGGGGIHCTTQQEPAA